MKSVKYFKLSLELFGSDRTAVPVQAMASACRPSIKLRKGTLTCGSDCSGLGTDIICLKKMFPSGTDVQHRFSSETNPHCRKVLESLGLRPFDGMKHPSEVPEVELYVCGFPCQRFSNLEILKAYKFEF